jgi:DNA-binding MarR family transcriptional regulator
MTSVTQTTTVALLKGMAARGLITRTRDDGDKRKSVVSLTPRGRALESRVLPDALELNRIALQGISADEIETCLAVIKRVAANLEAVYTTDPAAGG